MFVPPLTRGGTTASSGRRDAELLDQNGRHDDGALDDELILLLEVVDDEQVRDALEDHYAQQRPDDRAAAARERGPADDGRGDGVEFVQFPMVGRSRAGQ